MRAEYINAFYLATQDVFRIMLDLETNRSGLRVTEELVPFLEANVVIGVTGDLTGSLLYSFPKEMALEMVKIMSGMEMDELDAFVTPPWVSWLTLSAVMHSPAYHSRTLTAISCLPNHGRRRQIAFYGYTPSNCAVAQTAIGNLTSPSH